MAENKATTDTGLGAEAFQGAAREHTAPAESDLHVCPACTSQLVYPVDWAPARARQWSVALRCPDCEWLGEGVFAQDAVDRFDEVLDSATEQLLDDLSLLARANMEDHVERFVAALHANQILPEDF
jgi:predicted RNA-binding Zn-ribbon protein involved in translation (DUF1610 family)